MDNISFINKIDSQLRVMSELHEGCIDGQYRLQLTLFYHNENIGKLEFLLTEYSKHAAMMVAKNIKDNEFIMREIDEYLCGDVE